MLNNNDISNDFTVEERFQFLENYVRLIIAKQSNSLIVSGDSGLGKSWKIMEIIKGIEDLNYFLVKGFATSRALYDTLYRNRNKLIIFDDCDSILEDKVAINLLKGALDTYDERVVSWLSKSNDKSIPLQFDFQGQIIFISNLPLAKFDKAILSRALSIDVFMTEEEKQEQMLALAENENYLPNIDFFVKQEVALRLVPYMNKPSVNFRTLEKAIKVFVSSKDGKRAVEYIGETS